ncbi:glycosyl transferase family 1 [Candidatus Woesearchaeota archaeon]|nr:glycosyl transferase family 1 [Candidatus Woesearchaeota archaeon]|tara:strand:- start:17733 stop:18932 length:1200 start_codon:yes stop_codon:yes gene_type:complete
MRYKLKDYEQFAGKGFTEKIHELAKPLEHKHIAHLNSTYYGGGVAEILNSLVMLLNDVGIITGWRLIKGDKDFFDVTKQIHNALQGEHEHFSNSEKSIYINTNHANSVFTHLDRHELVFVHDPQPLPMIHFYKKKCPWIWRCHIDISNPTHGIWSYLKKFVVKYDAAVFSVEKFKQKLPLPQHIIPPAIDPLSSKNVDMKESAINKQLKKFDIPTDKPIIAQISRFDRWKDPWGVIDAYHLIKKKFDCRLVLLGAVASDDPEGDKIYEGIIEKAASNDNIHVISFQSDMLVNALQRASSLIIQNSIREGFGLTVAEALWKGTPVLTRRVGGIPLQVKNGYNGYFATDLHDFSNKAVKLLKNKKLAKKMGANGREHVRKNFLITRLLEDHLKLYKNVLKL